MLKNKRGQSTIEYIILVTAVIVIILLFMMSGNSPFKRAMNETLNSITDEMTNMSDRFQGSHK